MLALFGFSTMEEEGMTATSTRAAAAAAGNGAGTHLYVVPGDNKANMGALLVARAKGVAASARDTVTHSASWVAKTLHLDTAWGFARSAAAWVGGKVVNAARFLGGGGMLGAGMLGIATETGRKVIGTLLKPIGWLGRMLGRAWVATENLLFNENRNGGVRNWISDRMADVRIWAFGDDTKNGKMGVIPTMAVWAIKNVGQYFQYDSLTMKATRSAGTLLLAPRLLDLLAFVPVGPLYWPLRFIGSSAIAFAVLQPFFSLIGGVWDRIFPTVVEEIEAAEKTVDKTTKVIQGEVAQAVEQVEAQSPTDGEATQEQAEKIVAATTTAPATKQRGGRPQRGKVPARA